MTIAGTLLPLAIRKRPFFDSQSPIEYLFAARRHASAVHTRVCLSVCLSVCSSQGGVLWKRLNVSYLYAVQFVREHISANDCYTFLANVNSRSRSLYAIARPSVCRLSSVTPVRPTQALQIFCNISTIFGTLTSTDIHGKFYGDRPRGTPTPGS